jgi:hypothetical protein
MLREIGRRVARGQKGGGSETSLSKLQECNEKGETMEIVKGIHDLIIVLGFAGLIIIPRAVLTFKALREEEESEQLG